MAAPTPNPPAWLRIGDTGASLAQLSDAANGLGPIDLVIAVWWIRRRLACDALGEEAGRLAQATVAELDADSDLPPEPSLAELRLWISDIARLQPRGTMREICRAASLPSPTASKVLGGRTILPDRRERLAAAIVAKGRGWLESEGAPE